MTTLKAAAGCGSAAMLFLSCALAVGQEKQDDKKPDETPLPKDVVWKLKALEQEPLRLIRTDEMPRGRYWVFELTRDLDVYEDGAHWGPAFKMLRPRFRFELHDADGIVLKTVDARYIGDYVTKAGKRFGAYLEVPRELNRAVKTIEAIPK